MRAIFVLVIVSGCAGARLEDDAPLDSSPSTVRAQLAGETRWAVAVPGRGSIRAAHWSPDGWVAADVPIEIRGGSLRASADDRIEIDELYLQVAPIELPESLFGHAATLTDLSVSLAAPARLAIDWADDDHAAVAGPIDLTMAWTLAVDGVGLPLGTPRLPHIPIELAIGRDDGAITAALGASASGEIWSWAGLVTLGDLSLAVDAVAPPR